MIRPLRRERPSRQPESALQSRSHRRLNSYFVYRTAFGAGLLLALGLAPLACTQPHDVDPDDHVAADTDEHGLHVVDNLRLRYLMEQLSGLRLDQMPDEALNDREYDPEVARVAEMAEAMAEDARKMHAVIDDPDMTAESRRVFDKLASRMRDESRQLARAANRHDTPGMRRSLRAITATCNECHASFRGPHFAFDQSAEPADSGETPQ